MTPEDKKLFAILLTIREPTGAMVYDACNAGYCRADHAKVIWRAMIDRMMGELCKGKAEKWNVPIARVKGAKSVLNPMIPS